MDVTIHEEEKHRIPFEIILDGHKVLGEVVGESLPNNTHFEYRFTDAPNVFVEAVPLDSDPEKYGWVVSAKHVYSQLIGDIGKGVEKYFNDKTV